MGVDQGAVKDICRWQKQQWKDFQMCRMQNLGVKLSIYPDLQGIAGVFTLVFTFEIHGGLRISEVQGQKEVKMALPVFVWAHIKMHGMMYSWFNSFKPWLSLRGLPYVTPTLTTIPPQENKVMWKSHDFLEGMLPRALHQVLSSQAHVCVCFVLFCLFSNMGVPEGNYPSMVHHIYTEGERTFYALWPKYSRIYI